MQIYRKIKNLLDYAKTNNEPFININGFSFLDDYKKDYESFDNYIRLKYSNRKLYYNIYMKDDEELESVYTTWLLFVKSFLTANSYKYKTLFETTKFTYNPIENYDRKETVETVRTPNLITENNTTTVFGNSEIEEQLGNIKNTNTIQGSVSPWDSEEFNNRNKNVSESLQDSITNKTVNKTKTDIQDNAQLLTGTDKTDSTINVHGNIGVMSTQNMIEQERQIALFSFYEVLFRDIINFTTESIV